MLAEGLPVRHSRWQPLYQGGKTPRSDAITIQQIAQKPESPVNPEAYFEPLGVLGLVESPS
jgi:hypothetical protein